MTAHYNGSKGPRLISEMLYPHAVNARDKLVRERVNDSRDAEIAALNEHIASIDAMANEGTQA